MAEKDELPASQQGEPKKPAAARKDVPQKHPDQADAKKSAGQDTPLGTGEDAKGVSR